jgi:hypothetical protein
LKLCAFSGNLATAFPNTTCVESDFFILMLEKDDNRKAMTNLSLEGIFQAKQRELVMSIRWSEVIPIQGQPLGSVGLS